MLEPKYWEEARQLQDRAKKKTGYEDSLSGVLYWSEVYWHSQNDKHAISVLSEDIKLGLGIPAFRWNGESQRISRVMKGKVELQRSECEGLTQDVCWEKADDLRKSGGKVPLNGYCIRLSGEIGLRAYQILEQKKKNWNEEAGLDPKDQKI
jgi:hypothetical protein